MMLESFNIFWDKTQEFFIFFILMSLVIHFIRQHRKYKNVPREISSKLWYEVYLMHHSVKVIIQDQMLSIKKAKCMIESLEDIKINKSHLDKFLLFPRKLAYFDANLDQYILFLNDFIATHQSQLKSDEAEIKLTVQNKNSIHHHFRKELKLLENELWPASN